MIVRILGASMMPMRMPVRAAIPGCDENELLFHKPKSIFTG